MVNVIENNQPFPIEVRLPADDSGVSLSDFTSQINAEVNKTGKVIVSLTYNDQLCDINNLSHKLFVKDNDVIEIQTDTPLNISRSSLIDLISQLDAFVAEIDEIISLLIKGDKSSSFKKFSVFLQKFWEVVQLLRTIEALFCLNYAEMEFKDKTIKGFSENLVNNLTEIKSAMENEDLVTLTDVLEYEIKDVFAEDLRIVLQSIMEKLPEK